ncbi:unannotated protein [freshwater metagenome]|uniref:Unannotated protein n=1 Tax=freshwater metagenome TaxID=449393 RepID=A0A6J6NBB8_9ZZZZ
MTLGHGLVDPLGQHAIDNRLQLNHTRLGYSNSGVGGRMTLSDPLNAIRFVRQLHACLFEFALQLLNLAPQRFGLG